MKGLTLSSDGLHIKENSAYIQSTLPHLFFTGLNERINALTTGSRILNYFDEPIINVIVQAIIYECTELLAVYEPRIIPNAIGVTLQQEGNNMIVIINIEAILAETSETISIPINTIVEL